MSTITSGDTYPFTVDLTFGGAAFMVTAGSDTVKARWISDEANLAITAAVSQASGTTGANWAIGKIAVVFDQTNADLLAAYAGKKVILEIEVTKAGLGTQTFRAAYSCKKGWI